MGDNEQSRALENFKDATAATFRAISGHEKAQVRFTTTYLATSPSQLDPSYRSTDDMLSVPLPDEMDHEELMRIRGRVDGMALKLRHHDEALHMKHRPAGVSGELMDMLEEVRYQALGARQMPGVATNLEAMHAQYFAARGFSDPAQAKQMSPADIVARMLFERVSGLPPAPFAKAMHKAWDTLMEKKMGEVLDALGAAADDQEAFARLARSMGKILGLEGDIREEISKDGAPKAVNARKKQEAKESESAEKAEREAPLPESAGDQETAAKDEKEKNKDGDSQKQGPESPKAGKQPRRNTPTAPEAFFYRAYTTRFDKTVRARDLATPDELSYLRHQLDQRLSSIKDITSRLASRLQRKLMSRRMRSWKFHMEEGILDASKLTQIITDPSYSYYYKIEKEANDPNTVVTLLIDNSGSMRGRPITVAALSADILARTLERCGVRVEILGFTTVDWKGGRTRQQWIADGRPASPGRLNDLLHVIYKTADEPWRLVRRNLGLMLKDGLLKENIDGEALLWAHDRLLARREERKVLMVISDGAPVDDATLASNSGDYLDHHLRQVIGLIEHESPVELLAIGIGHEVGAYYQNAVTIREVEQLGDTMIGQLGNLFDKPVGAQPRKRRA
jgi:cobaltochelatase CobT